MKLGHLPTANVSLDSAWGSHPNKVLVMIKFKSPWTRDWVFYFGLEAAESWSTVNVHHCSALADLATQCIMQHSTNLICIVGMLICQPECDIARPESPKSTTWMWVWYFQHHHVFTLLPNTNRTCSCLSDILPGRPGNDWCSHRWHFSAEHWNVIAQDTLSYTLSSTHRPG